MVRWAVAACALSTSAWAAAFQLEARTEAQTYDQVSYQNGDPNNPTLLPHREIVQYLNLNGYELVTGQDLGLEVSLRLFADLGMAPEEEQALDGAKAKGLELLYANISYRTGGFDFQLGRQMYVDLMDYMSFDGLRVRYMSQFGVGVEAYAGLWVKGTSLFGSSVYQPDGTRDTDARRLALDAPTADPTLTDVEPVWGVKLLTDSFHGFSGSLGFRRAYLGGATDLERAAAELHYMRGLGLSAMAGIEWDVSMQRVAQARAQIRYDRELWAISAEAMRVTPVLSSESIWYYFANGARNELRLRADYTPVGPFRYYAQLTGALYDTVLNTNPTEASLYGSLSDPTLQSALNAGGSVGSAMRMSHVHAALDLTYRSGFGGTQLWVDLTGGIFASQELYTLDARLSYANVTDQLNPLLTGGFYGAQLWGGYKINRATRVSLVLEENSNPLNRYDTKVFFVFDFKTSV